MPEAQKAKNGVRVVSREEGIAIRAEQQQRRTLTFDQRCAEWVKERGKPRDTVVMVRATTDSDNPVGYGEPTVTDLERAAGFILRRTHILLDDAQAKVYIAAQKKESDEKKAELDTSKTLKEVAKKLESVS